MPCQMTPSNPLIIQVVGRMREKFWTQMGSMNEGNQSPPRMERLRMERIAMLRARFSVPPIAAINKPVAAESRAVAIAIRKNPRTEPLIATPKTRLPKLKVKRI